MIKWVNRCRGDKLLINSYFARNIHRSSSLPCHCIFLASAVYLSHSSQEETKRPRVQCINETTHILSDIMTIKKKVK